MTTVLETNANPSVPSAVSAMQDISALHIQESKTNPASGQGKWAAQRERHISFHAAFGTLRLRSPATFCTIAKMSFLSESVTLLRHFTSLCR
jgi:hypothetical protein